MTPVKVAIVGPVHPWRGGIAHHSAGLARALQRAGHTVEVINFRTLYLRVLFPGKTMRDESATALQAPQRPILRPLAPWTWLAAAREIGRSGAHAVVIQWWHVFFAPCLLSVLWLARRRGIPGTVICHNVKDHDRHGWLNTLANRLLARLASSIVIHSDADTRRFLRRFGPAPVATLPLPSFDFFTGNRLPREEARARLGLGAGPLCLFFGLIRPYKGLEDLLRAMALLRDEAAAPRLLIAGEFYEPVGRYHTLVRELGLDGRVTILDRYVPNEEVALYFSAADVLVAPYRTASQSAVVSIALSQGVPVIVSDAGGLPEMVEAERTGLVVPAGSPPELADAVRRFFAEGLAETFRAELRKQPDDASWTALVEQIEATAGTAPLESGRR